MNRISIIRLEAAFLVVAALAAESLPTSSQNLEEARVSIPVQLPVQAAQASSPISSAPISPASTEPNESEAEGRADALMSRMEYQAAIAAYTLAPLGSASVWNKMGIAYEMLFDNTAARRCYDKARQLEPKNASVFNNIASLEVSAKEFGRAEKSYRHAIKLDPHAALFHKNLGTAYISARKYKQGWEEYRAALAIDPQIFSTEAGLRVKNPTDAQDRGAMNFFMARGCLMAGDKKQAIEYLRMALNEGYTSPKKLVEDNEFAALRDMPAFQALIESETQSSHAQADR